MKAARTTIGGREHFLLFNGEAMFAVKDRFEGITQLLDLMQPDDHKGFNIALEVAALLAEQGELARRLMGHLPQLIPTAGDLRPLIAPLEVVLLKNAVIQAIELGFGREIKDDETEVDLGLAELDQKKTR